MVGNNHFHVVASFPGICGHCGCSEWRTPCTLVSSFSQGAGCDRWVRGDHNPSAGALMQGESLQGQDRAALSFYLLSLFHDGSALTHTHTHSTVMCVCMSVFDCPYLDVCPYIQDHGVKLFASPFMCACADLLVCMCVSVCALEVTHAGKRGRGERLFTLAAIQGEMNWLQSRRAAEL